MRCPIDSATHWRRCWQENGLSPFGLQDIHTHAKASPKQPEAALLISQCMFSLCSACVTSAAPLYLRQEKECFFVFFKLCKQQSWKYVPAATCGPWIYWALETVQVWFFFFFWPLRWSVSRLLFFNTHHTWRGSKMAEERDHFLRFAWNVPHFGQPQN